MLPDDFRWQNRYQYDSQRTALSCGGKQVALLLQTVGAGWLARLNAHQPITEPLVTWRCTTLESGRAGIELWAARHADRVRAQLKRATPRKSWRAPPIVAMSRQFWTVLLAGGVS